MRSRKTHLEIAGFRTKRFIVRPYCLSDFTVWQNAHSNLLPKQNQFDAEVRKPKELTRTAFKGKVKRADQLGKKNLIYFFGIFSKKSSSQLGEVLISLVVRFNVQSARISYGIFNNYWRQGIAEEVVSGLIRYGIKDLKLNRLEAEILPENLA